MQETLIISLDGEKVQEMLCEEQEPEVIIVEPGLTQEGYVTIVPNWYGTPRAGLNRDFEFSEVFAGSAFLTPH